MVLLKFSIEIKGKKNSDIFLPYNIVFVNTYPRIYMSYD